MQTAIWIGVSVLGAVFIFALAVAARMARRLAGRHVRRKPFALHRAFMEPHVHVRYPPGEGSFPCVVLVHGCGGVRRVTHAYAEAAAKAGVAAVIVDSLAPRGVSYEQALARVCTGRILWGRERAADLYAALDLVRADPRLDPGRIALTGWSHGGWTLLDAMALARSGQPPDGLKDAPREPFAGVRAALLIYPYMSLPALARRRPILAGVPIEAVLVEHDSMASEIDAAEIFARWKKAGHPVTWSTLGAVTHGFDEPDHHPESPLRYDSQASAETRAKFVDFLKRRLDPSPV